MNLGISQPVASNLRTSCPLILAVGLDYVPEWGDQNLRMVAVESTQEALAFLLAETVCVLVLGPGLDPQTACVLLSAYHAERPKACTSNIVVGCGSSLGLFQPFVDEDRLFYVARGPMPNAQLRLLVLAGVQHVQTKQKVLDFGGDTITTPTDRVLEFCSRLSFQTDLAVAGDLLLEALAVFISGDRARYLMYDGQRESLWVPTAESNGQGASESPCAGVVGYVARTGDPVRLERCAEDPRYDTEGDDPGGAPDARFLAEPMCGNSGTVIAVVTVARVATGDPFSDEDAATLKLLTACAASAFSGILLQRRIRAMLLEQIQPTLDPSKVFREEALRYYAAEQSEEGEILHTSPVWLKHTHWLTLVLVVLGLLWMVSARVHENADGPAMVTALHKITATASSAGMIRSVLVAQGDHVRAGDLLVQFYDVAGSTTLERVKQEVRAPSDGVVSDIRVHAGRVVTPGDQIATIIDEAGGYELVAFFPGYYAPQLHPGMKIILKIGGYPESHETYLIDHVGTEIIGPHEAERYAGQESADAALQVSGPVVSVRARLSKNAFRANDDLYRLYDGMTGEAEVTVHSEPFLVYLIPGLKGISRK